ncbi:hypothetical protein ACEPAH_3244 [Sanghuangporus vaninii]
MGSDFSENLTVEGQTVGNYLAHILDHIRDQVVDSFRRDFHATMGSLDTRLNFALGMLQGRLTHHINITSQGSQSALSQQLAESQREILRLCGADFLHVYTQLGHLVEQAEAIRARISNPEEEVATQYSLTEGIRRVQQTIRMRQDYTTLQARRRGIRLSPDSPLQGRGNPLVNRRWSAETDSEPEQIPRLDFFRESSESAQREDEAVDGARALIPETTEVLGLTINEVARTNPTLIQRTRESIERLMSARAEVDAAARGILERLRSLEPAVEVEEQREEEEVRRSVEPEEEEQDLPDYVSTDTQPSNLDQQAEALLREVIPEEPQRPWPQGNGWENPPSGQQEDIPELMWNEAGELVEARPQRLGVNGYYIERNELQHPHENSPPGSPTPSAEVIQEREDRLQASSEYSPDSDYMYDPILRSSSCPPRPAPTVVVGQPIQGVVNMVQIVWVQTHDVGVQTEDVSEGTSTEDFFDATVDWESEEESKEHESGEERIETRE